MLTRARLHTDNQSVNALKTISSNSLNRFQAFSIPFTLFSFLVQIATTALFDLLPRLLSISQCVRVRLTGGVKFEPRGHIFSTIGLRAIKSFKVSDGSLDSCRGTLFLGA